MFKENMSVESLVETQTEDSSDGRSGVELLKSWLNKNIKIKMSDGRILVGIFLCTDKAANIIIGSCNEYMADPDEDNSNEEPRVLGLAMVPGHHVVSVYIDDVTSSRNTNSPVRQLSPDSIDSDDCQ